jgi:putative membrane protein
VSEIWGPPLVQAVVLAHPGLPPEPHDLPTAWSLKPTLLLGLAIGAWAYGRGVRALWRRAGRGRGLARWRVLAFAAGMLCLLLALVSPVDALGAALFSAHMFQHALLVLVAGPLLVLGMPPTSLLWALDEPARRRVGGWWRQRSILRRAWRAVSHPASAWALHAAALWLWHLPVPYQAALTNDAVHLAEHASFLGTALLFWWAVLGGGPHAQLNPALGVLYLFTFSIQGGILGALMTFTSEPWYPAYAATTAPWGLSPLQDQQLAGVIMWIPGGLIYLVAALIPLALLLEAGNERTPVREQEHERQRSRAERRQEQQRQKPEPERSPAGAGALEDDARAEDQRRGDERDEDAGERGDAGHQRPCTSRMNCTVSQTSSSASRSS